MSAQLQRRASALLVQVSEADAASEASSSHTAAPPANTDPRQLTNAASVRLALADLSSYSTELDARLSILLRDSHAHRAAATESIAKLRPQVELIAEEAEVLRRRLSETANTAQRISSAVRNLDEKRDRVDRAKFWADRVVDLRASLLSLGSAMEQQDWDEATRHCIRAMSIDSEILHSNFAGAVVPTAEYPDPPPMTLLSLRQGLLDVFSRRFRAATEAKDTVEATRFFKMFPLIGWQAEGLGVYCEFAKVIVRERGRSITDALVGGANSSSAHHHSGLLTTLFEHLALLIDQHQPLVDRNYGPGNFLNGVMPGLQEECDRLGRRIWDAWWDERAVPHKLDSARSYSFAYVATLGATNTRANAASGIKALSLPGRPSTPANGQAAEQQHVQSGPDAREIDRVLTEAAGMANRWGTYRTFLAGRLGSATTEPSTAEATEPAAQEQQQVQSIDIATNSALGKKIAEGLEQAYVPLETWYLRSSVERAHRMDTPDLAARPTTSSVLDDVFYVLRLVLARALSTSSIATVSAMTKAARWIIDEEYVQALVRRMEGVWRSVSASMAVDGPRKEAGTREMKSTFVVYLNVLNVSADYMARILAELTAEQALLQHFAQQDVAEVASMVQGLSVLVTRIKSAVRTETDQLFTQLTRPRLRAIISEAYRDVTYALDDDAFAEAEYEDLVRRRFIKGWETVLAGYEELFNEANWEAYFALTLESLVQPWEAQVMHMRYTELGALRFDKDIRTISTYLSTHTRAGGVRERLARLQQISYVLNLDEADASPEGEDEQKRDLYEEAAAAGMAWRLSSDEVKAVRRLRV